jgi:hypothetical protein
VCAGVEGQLVIGSQDVLASGQRALVQDHRFLSPASRLLKAREIMLDLRRL